MGAKYTAPRLSAYYNAHRINLNGQTSTVKVYLARHGEAVPKVMNISCPLSETGIKDIERIAAFLAPRNIQVAHIFHSGILRAEQTAERLSKAFQSSAKMEAHDHLHPNDPVTPIASELKQADVDILIVGHMPFMSRLVSKLVIGDENQDVVQFQTGTLVCLERIGTSSFAIQWVVTPELVGQ